MILPPPSSTRTYPLFPYTPLFRSHECDPAPRLIDDDKRQQFAHEIAGARKTYRCHGKEQEKHGITRHIDRKTAITADLTGVQSIINYANTQDTRAGKQGCGRFASRRRHRRNAYRRRLVRSLTPGVSPEDGHTGGPE